jgi:cytochrome c-type biogenesis protein CcmH
MMLFWALSALLAALALWFVVRPLIARDAGARVSRDGANLAIHRDQLRELEADVRAGTLDPGQYEKARRELEARLLDDLGSGAEAPPAPRPGRAAAVVIALLIPLGALAIYLVVGTPAALAPGTVAAGGSPHAPDMKELEVAVERLAARLKESPDDTEGWIMLARSYRLFGRFEESAQAYARAAAREPRDAQLLADYADMLAMAQGRNLQGEPEKLVARALEIDPRNLKALALAGSAAFDRKDYTRAVALWERMLPLLSAESEDARSVQASINEARALGGASGGQPAAATAAAPALQGGVSGTVALAPGLAGKVAPQDTVFIFARAAEGPRMPLAILRKQVRDLPVAFVLDDSMAMTPEMTLSKFPRVVVGARVSRSGSATPQPGDLEGVSAPVASTARGVTVTITGETR